MPLGTPIKLTVVNSPACAPIGYFFRTFAFCGGWFLFFPVRCSGWFMFLSRPIFDRNNARFILAVVTASDHARGTRNSMALILFACGGGGWVEPQANFLGAACAAPCCYDQWNLLASSAAAAFCCIKRRTCEPWFIASRMICVSS